MSTHDSVLSVWMLEPYETKYTDTVHMPMPRRQTLNWYRVTVHMHMLLMLCRNVPWREGVGRRMPPHSAHDSTPRAWPHRRVWRAYRRGVRAAAFT